MPVNCNVAAVEQQKIAIRNKYGEKLVGLLHETGSTEIVILCHGFQCVKVCSCDTLSLLLCLKVCYNA